MHAVGLHSALAIRRERKRRNEQKRARERRFSGQSSDSGLTSPHNSTGSLERRNSRRPRKPAPSNDSEVVTSMGMLHLGVVFLVLGIFLTASGLLPDDITSWSALGSTGWWNELVCTGLFAGGLGIFLILLHRYIAKNEEDALEAYVQRQLTRSRSGHKLERDAETGGLLTRHHRRHLRSKMIDAEAVELEPELVGTVGPRSPPLYSAPPSPLAHGFVNALALSGETPRDMPLELIAEEECSVTSEETRRLDRFNRDTYSNGSAHSLSPGTPSDTKELLANGRYMVMSRM